MCYNRVVESKAHKGEDRVYKKFLIWPLIIVASLLPVGISHGASKANVTKVRVVTRNDADIPFVRTVLMSPARCSPGLPSIKVAIILSSPFLIRT